MKCSSAFVGQRDAATQLRALFFCLVLPVSACTGSNQSALDMDASAKGFVVVNEVYSSGNDALSDPDWVELKTVGTAPIDLSAYRVRDEKTTAPLPSGTVIEPGKYLLIYCDDLPDGGASDRIHVPFKLGAQDAFSLLAGDGTTIDGVTWDTTMSSAGKSYGRLPDGTGQFLLLTPTQGVRNL
jgi:hypothetical protein